MLAGKVEKHTLHSKPLNNLTPYLFQSYTNELSDHRFFMDAGVMVWSSCKGDMNPKYIPAFYSKTCYGTSPSHQIGYVCERLNSRFPTDHSRDCKTLRGLITPIKQCWFLLYALVYKSYVHMSTCIKNKFKSITINFTYFNEKLF